MIVLKVRRRREASQKSLHSSIAIQKIHGTERKGRKKSGKKADALNLKLILKRKITMS